LPSMLVTRQALSLRPNPARVVLRPFQPAVEPRERNRTDKRRANHIVDRVLALDPKTADGLLADVQESFQGRHRDLAASFEARASDMEEVFAAHSAFGRTQRQLIGAFFMHEYSFESAALFNPSIVSHPDQSGMPSGALRFILSLRAVGEGHISSVTFRSGVVAANGTVSMDPSAHLACIPQLQQPQPRGVVAEHIDVAFRSNEDISERVIFPITASQCNGIEDARFVEFNEDGQKTYYATYTAYSGKAIRSELIETTDFKSFRMSPLKGSAARNKGMALFPRKFDGRYAMIGRQDNERLYLIYSDDLYSWGEGVALLEPQFPWEFVQIGNCGSPIELDEGWLLLTHGVGPVRRYSIGAALLDKSDPSKVLGRCSEPLLRPEVSEREGYVPNVLYTCGAVRHHDRIILPYAVSDTYCTFATIEIPALMRAMR
jgi:predicted GH43/DUF377 family glycosyl hydrolase